jgi:predicted Zn-dependent protease
MEILLPPAEFELARTYYHLAKYAEADSLLVTLVARSPANPIYLAYRAAAAYHLGNESVLTALSQRLDTLRRPYDRGLTDYARAMLAAQRGDLSDALTALERSLGTGMPSDGVWVEPELMFKPLWHHPKFESLIMPKD